MDRRTLNIFNAAILIIIVAAALLSWFYMRDQFVWGIILIFLVLLVTVLVNLAGRGLSNADAWLAIAAFIVLGFSWFYLRDQFCLAGFFVVLLLAVSEYLKLKKWLKDVVSIQVVIHKNENGEGRKADEEDNKK
jgi:cell division protein FtsW (lipid II flippase)